MTLDEAPCSPTTTDLIRQLRGMRLATTPAPAGVLGFDQPLNGLAQMAFVVPDVRAAVLRWTASCNAGPWFVIDALAAPDAIYRREPCRAAANVALG